MGYEKDANIVETRDNYNPEQILQSSHVTRLRVFHIYFVQRTTNRSAYI
jgi:hypothetical protein